MRYLIPLLGITILFIATVIAGAQLLERRQQALAADALEARLSDLQQAEARWRQRPGDSLVDADLRQEARRTLRLLRELYAHEHQLWTYFEALEGSHDARAQYLENRIASEQRIQAQEEAMRRLEAAVESLRPPNTDGASLSFIGDDQSPSP